eukprot:6489198-Amphidinium_carterae.1
MTWWQRPSRSLVSDSPHSLKALQTSLQGIAPPRLPEENLDERLRAWTECWKQSLYEVAGLPESVDAHPHIAKPVERSYTMGQRTRSV